ncbi:MAG: GYD domain-containing protein [Acetobacteraceae bacterium]|nr:GYD domain-containing protein [Acetobacteraceae bacterium]
MPKFLIAASFTPEGLRELQKDKASGRRQAIASAIESLGGKLEAAYYALGEHDVFIIADLPSHIRAAALSVAASAAGLVRTHTTALLTVEEADEALQQMVQYRPPGG